MSSQKSLEALFAEVRDAEPHFSALEFTDAVMAGLPEEKRISRKRVVFTDVAATTLGIVACASLIPGGFVTGLIDAVTSAQVTISSMTIVLAAVVTLSASVLAWWTVEGRNRI